MDTTTEPRYHEGDWVLDASECRNGVGIILWAHPREHGGGCYGVRFQGETAWTQREEESLADCPPLSVWAAQEAQRRSLYRIQPGTAPLTLSEARVMIRAIIGTPDLSDVDLRQYLDRAMEVLGKEMAL